MTKEEVLDFKPASRLEQIGDMHSKRCADSPSPRKSVEWNFRESQVKRDTAEIETAFGIAPEILHKKFIALMPRHVVRKVVNIIQTPLRHET